MTDAATQSWLDAETQGPDTPGRDQARAADATAEHLGATDGKRIDCPVDCRLADAVRDGDTFAKANDAREGIDDAKAVPGGTSHQKPAVIGAEIERRVSG